MRFSPDPERALQTGMGCSWLGLSRAVEQQQENLSQQGMVAVSQRPELGLLWGTCRGHPSVALGATSPMSPALGDAQGHPSVALGATSPMSPALGDPGRVQGLSVALTPARCALCVPTPPAGASIPPLSPGALLELPWKLSLHPCAHQRLPGAPHTSKHLPSSAQTFQTLLLLDSPGMWAGSTSGCPSLQLYPPTDPHGTAGCVGGGLWGSGVCLWGFIFCIKIFILEATREKLFGATWPVQKCHQSRCGLVLGEY